ncbi:MAG: FadR family transcriptional regulator [Burkholderiales bacterium]|nr:FadR family transcriptional regulator [Anaerolineae bacterium]
MAQQPTQVYTSVVEAMKLRMAQGEWDAGQRLPSINQLAREYGVGVGSIREAVKVLESLGVIRIEHGRGMFVQAAQPAPEDDGLRQHFQNIGVGSILALCEARRIIEPELAAFAAERGSDAELEEIRAQALRMQQLADDNEDFLEPDLNFHQYIARAAHNPVLERMMDSLNDLLLESRDYTLNHPSLRQRAPKYHVLIADAISERNALQARLVMLAHVNDTTSVLLAMQGMSPADENTKSVIVMNI